MLIHDPAALRHELGTALFAIGTVCWVIALLWMIRDGRRERANAMPLAAILSNLGYQFYFGFVCPATQCAICPYGACAPADVSQATSLGLLWTWRAWLLMQLVIFVQLLRYGREQPQELPLPRRAFVPTIVVLLLTFYVGQATYTTFYVDFKGNAVTYVSNLMMSALFVPLLWARSDARGLTMGPAVSKLLGSGLQAVAILLTLQEAYPNHEGAFGFIYFLFAGIFLFDLLYVVLLRGRRAQLATAAA